jgi:16S rRNA (guanine1516-N2)-methyltransferase
VENGPVIPLAYHLISDIPEAKRLATVLGLPFIHKSITPKDIPLYLGRKHHGPMRLLKADSHKSNVEHLATLDKQEIGNPGLLYLDNNRLTLFCCTSISKQPLSLSLDFTAPKMRTMAREQNKKTLLAKAIGAKSMGESTWIVDATAGLGQDAFMLAYMGYKVTLIERSSIVATLLSHAISKVRPDSWAFSTVHRMHLLHRDAKQWLTEQSEMLKSTQKPAVVYLDPMFPHRDKKSLSQKSMQILQQLLGQDLDAETLLPLAKSVATERVVVKRHRASPHLCNEIPQIIFEGKSHRFDVYLI